MSFKILLLMALFLPMLLVAAGTMLHGPHRQPTQNTQLPP
jgi:hypothetical protein